MEASELLLSLCHPSSAYDSKACKQSGKLCAVIVDFLVAEVREFLRRHEEEWSGDTTPLTIRQTFVIDRNSLHVRMSGKSCQDIMVQRWLSQAADGSTVALLNAPRVVTDKTAWTPFECMRLLNPLPSARGHQWRPVVCSRYVAS